MNKVFILSFFATLLIACEPIKNSSGEPPILPDELYGVEIGTFYVENRNITLRLMDITSLYQEVGYTPMGVVSLAVPVNHLSFQNLPTGLKEPVKQYALSAPSQVYQMKWRGETVYHLICPLVDDIIGVYKPSGERITFASMEAFFQFLQEISDVHCLLLIDTAVVKSAEGAPNLLEGFWQTDWLHLHHDIGGTNGSGIDDQVELYADLPFSITEVCHFEQDGTGYLRTVKTLKNGKKEVAYDPFNYWLTDYQSNTNGYKGYYYLCIFAAGDTIEYSARSWDDFSRVYDKDFTFVTYPWYKQLSDSFSSQKGDPKYGIPEKDKKSPIVGRWTGVEKSASLSFGIHPVTFVFRSDGTGYQLYGRGINQSFAYTVDGNNGSELQLTLYKYDTGFYISDGFWKEGDWTYNYVQQPVPTGKKMKAKVYDDGNSLELQGWTNLAADQSHTPIIFRRVNKQQ
jgi:hypothetical protein